MLYVSILSVAFYQFLLDNTFVVALLICGLVYLIKWLLVPRSGFLQEIVLVLDNLLESKKQLVSLSLSRKVLTVFLLAGLFCVATSFAYVLSVKVVYLPSGLEVLLCLYALGFPPIFFLFLGAICLRAVLIKILS